eukprot:scaffold110393_cov75-Phaeocystis_antarctica.AAC.1
MVQSSTRCSGSTTKLPISSLDRERPSAEPRSAAKIVIDDVIVGAHSCVYLRRTRRSWHVGGRQDGALCSGVAVTYVTQTPLLVSRSAAGVADLNDV